MYPPGGSGEAPPGPPPSYQGGPQRSAFPEKGGYPGPGGATGSPNISEDERLARQLQQEEEAKVRSRGAADSYYSGAAGGVGGTSSGVYPGPGGASSGAYPGPGGVSNVGQAAGAQTQSKGFLGKLLGKHTTTGQPGYSQQSYPQQGYAQPQYAQQGYGGYTQQPQYVQQQQYVEPQRKHGLGGLGVGSGAALGLGGGLLGGMLIGDMISHEENNSYDQGYMQGVSGTAVFVLGVVD